MKAIAKQQVLPNAFDFSIKNSTSLGEANVSAGLFVKSLNPLKITLPSLSKYTKSALEQGTET